MLTSHYVSTDWEAIDELKENYTDVDTWREIRDHGCSSGVCHSHIYYVETNKFFDKYEHAIVGYLEDCIGKDGVVDIFQGADNDIVQYKNEMCWAFIQYVSQSIVDDYEEEYEP